MDSLVRLAALAALSIVTVWVSPAAAEYEGPDGYGGTADYQHDVPHDGYARPSTTTVETNGETVYVVIEAEDGTTEVVDGETVVVVQEPDPVAATAEAPPAPQTVVVQQATCPQNGIWVDGHWSYSNGNYIWIDGHCVVQRVDYVFVHPRWDFYSNVWWFVPGYYRPCGVYVGFGYYRPWAWFPPYYRPYYRAYRPVPVHRGVPRRPTTVRTAPRAPSRGVVPRRPGYAPRSPAVGRRPSVNRVPATRTPPITRAPATRASTVGRAPLGRGPSVQRTPSTRAPTVGRARPNVGRAGAVVDRVPPSASRASTVSRPGRASTLTRTAPAPRARTGIVTGPRPNRPAATSSVTRRGGAVNRSVGSTGSRSSVGSARSGRSARPTFGTSRGGGFSRPSSSRGIGGRYGGRPSGGSFGGSRSVPSARGR